jgi:magnesium transporter
MPKSHFYHITPTGKFTPFVSPAKAKTAVKAGGFLWLDYYQPTREELAELVAPFGLHPLAIEDCLDDEQVPKIESFHHNTFILFNSCSYKNGRLIITEVNAFLGPDFLITISQDKALAAEIQRLAEREIENTIQGPAFLLHIFLDYIVDQKFTALDAFEDELDRTEDTMFVYLAHFNPITLIRLRRDLLSLRKSLFHEREILVKICRKDYALIPEQSLFFFRDIYDHLTKFFEMIEAYRDIVTSLMEMHLSMLNNQMAKASNEMNLTVRRLTFITTIFMPLTLLAGIGGMSEWSMMTGPQNWKLSYPLFIAAMFVIGLINYYLLKWSERENRKKKRRRD